VRHPHVAAFTLASTLPVVAPSSAPSISSKQSTARHPRGRRGWPRTTPDAVRVEGVPPRDPPANILRGRRPRFHQAAVRASAIFRRALPPSSHVSSVGTCLTLAARTSFTCNATAFSPHSCTDKARSIHIYALEYRTIGAP
jgi:hypothetical protein